MNQCTSVSTAAGKQLERFLRGKTSAEVMHVARPRRQEARRDQLVEAASRAIAARGLAGLRLKHIADEAGITIGSVLYYYPNVEDLLTEVHQRALEVFYWDRVRATEQVSDLGARLRVAVSQGVPAERETATWRVIYELHAAAARNPVHAALLARLWDREVDLYERILNEGAGAGEFRLRGGAREIAETVVALEDAFDLHLTSNNGAVSRENAIARILAYLDLATGSPVSGPAPVARGRRGSAQRRRKPSSAAAAQTG
jgi:AcrR family transcriptional regulator